jgi:hypothetical protein
MQMSKLEIIAEKSYQGLWQSCKRPGLQDAIVNERVRMESYDSMDENALSYLALTFCWMMMDYDYVVHYFAWI